MRGPKKVNFLGASHRVEFFICNYFSHSSVLRPEAIAKNIYKYGTV